jgi:hypothetical protein
MAEETFGDEETVELLQAADEPEARGIESLLRDQGIECTLVPFADRAYPGILDRERTWGKWGAIRVARADEAAALQLVEEWRKAIPVESEAAAEEPITARTRRPFEGVLKGLAFAASLAVNLYFYITYVVQPTQTEVEFSDADGRVIARYKYRPPERYAYETLGYDARGRHVSTSFDRDADGWPERWTYLYGSGLRDEFTDEDENGQWDVNNTYRGQRLIGVDQPGSSST